MSVVVRHGDCLDHLRVMPAASVHAVVCDPPYNLSFMGRAWDSHDTPLGFQRWCEVWASECLRVLTPGGYLLAFGGTRTAHRLTAGVEDAGFEIRDSITWLYGSGFPKSLDVSKAIDKAAGAEREVIGKYQPPNGKAWNLANDEAIPGDGGTMGKFNARSDSMDVTAPATDAARQWAGWGTALKPASEPIIVARKPFQGTVAANVAQHGTGALNVDACRVDTNGEQVQAQRAHRTGNFTTPLGHSGERPREYSTAGRWPANVVLSHGECGDVCQGGCPVAELDAQSGTSTSIGGSRGGKRHEAYGMGAQPDVKPGFGDTGGASRFFPAFRYQAKAPTSERPKVDGVSHPTVKPLALMRWLVRLVTPPGGLVLDPFAGSGSTVEAALLEGFDVIGIEREADYLPLIQARVDRAMTGQGDLFATPA